MILSCAIALGAAGALPPAAGAVDYCVGPNVDCGAGNVDSFRKALDLADDDANPDRIFLGPGPYTAPDNLGFQYIQTGPVEVVGAGRGQTVLTGPPGGEYILGLFSGPGTSVHDLTIQLPQNATDIAGLLTDSAARRIEVVEDPSQSGPHAGVELENGGTLEDSSVTLHAVAESVAVTISSGEGTVRRSVLQAPLGVRSGYGGTIEQSRITAWDAGVLARRNTTSVSGSLIRMVGTTYGDGVAAVPSPGYDTELDADGLTIIGNGVADSAGARATNEPASDQSAELRLTNSVIRGFGRSLSAEAGGLGQATVFASYSDYEGSGSPPAGTTGTIVESNVSNVHDAGFVDPGAGDYHLLPGSPLVDLGDPGTAQGADLDGNPLVADGNGDAAARRDLGAFELQPAAAPGGGGGEAGTPAPGDTLAPVITGFRATPARFVVAHGTRFNFRLSERARVTVSIQRARPGRRYRTVGSLSRTGASGLNRVKFRGRLHRRALRPSTYRAVITALDAAGNRAARKTTRFRIVRR